jgi:leucyl aminopeptidase
MKALAEIKPVINVVAVVPIAENTPSGSSAMPGDIIRFYNGKTAEVKNTDAEGRLILADALAYITKNYKISAVVDLATLTGACVVALGPYFTGLISNNDALAQQVEHAGKLSGDVVWRLPLTDDYRDAIKCDIADLCNIGRSDVKAGTITAAAFLENFVGATPWVHLDIAGTAFDVPGVSYQRRSAATGVGVRLLVDLAANWKSLEVLPV